MVAIKLDFVTKRLNIDQVSQKPVSLTDLCCTHMLTRLAIS